MKFCFRGHAGKVNLVFSAVLLVLTLLPVHPLWAHKIGESYIYLRVFDDALSGDFHITLGDLNKALGNEAPEAQITGSNITQRITEVHAYYAEKVRFFDGENELPIKFSGVGMMTVSEAHDHPGNYVVLAFALLGSGATPESVGIDYNVLFDKDPDHLALVGIEYHWRAGIFDNKSQISLVFSPDDRRQQLSLATYSVWRGFSSVVKLGITHIWKGIEHVLFVIALLLPAAMLRKDNGWRPVDNFGAAVFHVIKIVALFTIAHSLTLSIAATGRFTLPSRLVESAIAISWAAAALGMIYPIFSRKIGWVAVIFGLFHGCGFARELSWLAVLGEHMTLSLLGFNLGVMIGQLVIIGLLFPMIYFIRHHALYPKVVLRYGAFAMIFLSTLWFVDRAFLGLDIRAYVKESVTAMVE